MIGPFRGDYAYLSNFYICPVRFEDIVFPSAEHAYQAAKSLDPNIRMVIRALEKPGDAKRFAKTIELRPHWNKLRLTAMSNIVNDKFYRNPLLGKRLVETYPEKISEINWWGDIFWGICKGVGEDHLGRILMETRESLMGD